ncbi:hypothetical protein HK099_005056 [Clydaea vesicula]|uniref:E3 ubiquitin-protein ligase n=1 Tax=Clydaea vesicula TaxID=447962 RepID=A0AAD5U6Q4_9FUNG|nr:hypothetical protein HK099_005056 [Clydaea vesicula]
MSDTFSMSKLGFSYLAAKERVGFHYPKLHCEGEACKSKKVVLIPQALKHLLCGKKLKEEGFRFGLSSGDMRIKKDIVAFLDLLKVWQGMNPIKRELRNHIEFESENWLNSFSIVLQTKDLRSQFAECFAPTENLENDIITLKEVVSLTIECLDQWCSAEQAEENKELNIEKYQNVEFIPKSECFIGKFKVSSQLVSFLHPLSWFLAHLLTFVPKLNFPANNPDSKDFLQKLFVFKSLDLVKENISDDNRILRLIEPCIRVNSLIAQIKCGLWVRNGFSVRNQALHYKEGSLRDCMDNDIFMLQIGACLVEPNKFLITLIDRFELLNWLSGITQVKVPPSELQFPTLIPHLSVDSMQWVSLAEEFLQLLIIILTERTRLCGESFEAELFREVIHHLATQTNGMAFSELNKRIAVRLNDFGDSNVSEATLEKVLNKVAKFKFPEGIADFGLYELKDEYYSQIDCWFWHYTRNQREEIEAILAKKGIKNNMSLPFYDTDGISITLPSIKPLSANFLSLNKIILSKTFIKILLVSLWNVTRTVTEQNQQFPPVRNDAVVSSMLHLLFCSIVIGKEEFLKLCVTQKVQIFPTPYTKQKETDEGLTVMELILELLECSEEETFLKDFIVRLKVLVNEFERTESGLLIITEWKAKIREKFGLKEGNYVTEKDKILKKKNQSKADAKQRRLKVMDQFNSQQKQFKTNFESDLNNVDSLYVPKPATNLNTLITEKSWDFPEGTCIVCQEGASGDGEHLYGMLALIQPSMIQRNLNFSSKESVEEALNVPPSLDTNLNHSVDEEVTNIKYPPTFTNTPGLQATSCGHLMHFHCFKNYTGSLVIRHQAQLTRNHPENLDRKEFMCPLCKSLGNCLLPILWSEKKETLNWCLNNDKNSEEESFFSFANYWNTNLKAKIKKQIEKNNFEEDVEMGESTRTEHSVFQSFHDNSCKLISGLNNALELHYTTDTDITSTTNFTEPAIPGRFPSDRNSVSLKVSEIQRYSKLLETVMTLAYHHINQGYEHEDFGLKLLDLLWETFFYTISCVEILSRGVIGNSVDILGSTKAEANGFVYTGVLENSSEQNLTLLRVLSETIMTQSTFATQDAKVEEQLLLRVSEFFKSLFFGLIDPKSAPEFINELSNNNGEDLNNPLLTEDTIFSLLVECTMSALPVLGIVEFAEVQKFIGILWALEIVKCLVGVIESVGVMHDNWCSDPKFSSFNFPTQANVSDRKGKKLVSDNMGINDGAEDSEIKSFFSWLMISLGMKPDVIQYTKKMVTSSVLLTLTKAVCLPFLRKTCLLVHAKFGVIAPGLDESTTSLKADLGLENEALGDVADEYTRLCRYLNLPLVESVCSNKTMNDETLSKLISGWCVHLSQYDLSHFYHAKVPMDVNFKEIDEDKERLLTLALPSIYSLVNLPNRLDILFEESKKQICKRCLNIPQNPAVCLLCGLIVCHQSFCCQEGDDGECNLHCNSYGNGCLLDAPYLDSHGEVDIGLR